jgi:hypothetical protein
MRFRNKTPKSSRACQAGSFPILGEDHHDNNNITDDDKIAWPPKNSPVATESTSASADVVVQKKQAKNRNRNRVRGASLLLSKLKCSSRADPEDQNWAFRSHKMYDDGNYGDDDCDLGLSGNVTWIEEPLPILEAPLVEFDTEDLDDDDDDDSEYSSSHLNDEDDDVDGTSSCGFLFEDSILSSESSRIGIQPFCVTQQVEDQMRERERAESAAAAAVTTTADASVSTALPEAFYLDGEKTVSMGPSSEAEESSGYKPNESSRPRSSRPSSDLEESSGHKPNENRRPRPRPISLSSKVVAPVERSVTYQQEKESNDKAAAAAIAVAQETYIEEQGPAGLGEALSNRGRVTFRGKTAQVLQETRHSSTNTMGVPVIDVSDQEEMSNLRDMSFSPSMDSSYNSAMHDLSFGLSMESVDVDDLSSDSSYESSENDDLGEPSIIGDDDSFLGFKPTLLLENDEIKKSHQAYDDRDSVRKDESTSYSVRNLISGPSIDTSVLTIASSNSSEEQKSDKADYDWLALRNKEKQSLDLDKNQSESDQAHDDRDSLRKDESTTYPVRDLISLPSIDSSVLAIPSSESLEEQKSDKADYDWLALRNKEKQRLDLDKNQSDKKREGVEWRKPPPHRDYPTYSARVSYSNARTGVLESGSTQEKPKPTKAPAATSRIKDLICRFERQDASSEPESKPKFTSRKAHHSERENRQDVGDRVDSISSSFSSSADRSDFPTGQPRVSPTTHSFFWRSHPRVESSESQTEKSSVSTVGHAKLNPQLVATSRSIDADSESYAVRVDSSFDSLNMADHQPTPSARQSVSDERRFL